MKVRHTSASLFPTPAASPQILFAASQPRQNTPQTSASEGEDFIISTEIIQLPKKLCPTATCQYNPAGELTMMIMLAMRATSTYPG